MGGLEWNRERTLTSVLNTYSTKRKRQEISMIHPRKDIGNGKTYRITANGSHRQTTDTDTSTSRSTTQRNHIQHQLIQHTKGLTMRNVSILSSNSTGTASTLRILAYPPVSTLQCFSIAWKIDQPWLRYRTSPVRRNAMNRDSTVSGLRRVSVRWNGMMKEGGGGLPEDVACVVGRCFAHAV